MNLKKKEPIGHTEEQFEWFLRGYKYAITKLTNDRKKDIRLDFVWEDFKEIDEMYPK